MKLQVEVETSLIYALLEALKTPHIATMLGMLGVGVLLVACVYVVTRKK